MYLKKIFAVIGILLGIFLLLTIAGAIYVSATSELFNLTDNLVWIILTAVFSIVAIVGGILVLKN